MDEDRVVLIGGWWKPTFTHLIIDQHAVIASRLDNAPEANNQYSEIYTCMPLYLTFS